MKVSELWRKLAKVHDSGSADDEVGGGAPNDWMSLETGAPYVFPPATDPPFVSYTVPFADNTYFLDPVGSVIAWSAGAPESVLLTAAGRYDVSITCLLRNTALAPANALIQLGSFVLPQSPAPVSEIVPAQGELNSMFTIPGIPVAADTDLVLFVQASNHEEGAFSLESVYLTVSRVG